MKKQIIMAYISGLLIGVFIGYTLMDSSYKRAFADVHNTTKLQNLSKQKVDVGTHTHDEEFHRFEDDSLAKEMLKNIRVLCWVMTGPQNHQKKAKHVKNTWGKRCNILLFMSSIADESLPSIALPVAEGRNNLWGKTKEAFKYVYKHYADKADWFLKADDDTYVVLENLRYMLQTYNSSQAIYFGCKFKPYVKQGYMSGGAGYVLSKEALNQLVEKAVTNATLCRQSNEGNEDVELGKCLENVKVEAGDSRDSHGRGRFLPFVPEHHLIPGILPKSFWYWKMIYYDSKEGMNCCSDNAVSFHYVSPNQMYVLEYLIYHLKPYGISYSIPLETSERVNID